MVYAIKLEFDLGFVHSARLYRGWKGRAVAYKRYSEAMQENGQFGAPFLIFFSLSLSLFFSLSLYISICSSHQAAFKFRQIVDLVL